MIALRAARAAGAAHDVPRRRPGRLAARDPRAARRSSPRCELAHAAGVPVTMLGGGSNVLVVGRRRPRPGDPAARRRHRATSMPAHVRADAAVTINGLVRWTINHGVRRSRGLGGNARHRRRRHFRQRALFGGRLIGDLVDRRALSRRRTATSRDVAARRAWRSDTIAAACSESGEVLLSAVFRCRRGEPAALRAIGAGVAGVSQAHAAARYAERGLRLSESGARAATSCRTASRGRPARWSIAPA